MPDFDLVTQAASKITDSLTCPAVDRREYSAETEHSTRFNAIDEKWIMNEVGYSVHLEFIHRKPGLEF